MIAAQQTPLAELYEADETAWLDASAELIRAGRIEELDYEHLAEFLSDMANRDRREVENRLAILLAHILKWIYQPDRRSGGWKATVFTQQQELRRHVRAGVLRSHARSVIQTVYADAILQSAAETGISSEVFPVECPWNLDEILSADIVDRYS